MGKTKRRKANQASSKPYEKSVAKSDRSSKQKVDRTSSRLQWHGENRAKSRPTQPPHLQQPLPFQPSDKILLVGEGDLSFAASLAQYHDCTRITATTLETKEVLLAKYPQAGQHLESLAELSQSVLFSIDATKLGLPHAPGASELRKRPGFDVVIFNFPHVGGKSTDVNRQVRSNQELVVKFLEGSKRVLRPGGSVVVTIFEGQPYELWGLRNLARHVGLSVERSMRFVHQRFPGYKHARTLGNIEGGWKAEDRDARMYILVKAGENLESQSKKGRKDDESKSEDSD